MLLKIFSYETTVVSLEYAYVSEFKVVLKEIFHSSVLNIFAFSPTREPSK